MWQRFGMAVRLWRGGAEMQMERGGYAQMVRTKRIGREDAPATDWRVRTYGVSAGGL